MKSIMLARGLSEEQLSPAARRQFWEKMLRNRTRRDGRIAPMTLPARQAAIRLYDRICGRGGFDNEK